MGDLNMQLVREFFELNQFQVLTHWQHDETTRTADPGALLFIEQRHPDERIDADFLLRPETLPAIPRAVVEVRAWHADRFYPSVIESSPVLGHVAETQTLSLAKTIFGDVPFKTILIISELPASSSQRDRAIELLRALGMDHILEFPTLLQDIVNRISAHGNYAPSQTLRTIRLLKRYGMVRLQQLEFAFKPEPLAPPTPTVSVAKEPETDNEEEA